MKLFFSFLFSLLTISGGAATFSDAENADLHQLFLNGSGKYVIRFHHQFNDTLIVPNNSELYFENGGISGPVIFQNTKLSGNVKLNGSTIGGSVRNRSFNASWLCAMDGMTDDASHINEIIMICNKVFFPRGIYRLISTYDAGEKLPRELANSIKSHIGICRSDITLIGEKGAEFITDQPFGTICFFSGPNQIENSISNIKIDGITFTVKNDGVTFHEFIHTIKLIGVNGMTITNCRFDDFWGDAICLSHYGDTPSTGERTRNQHISILHNTIIGGNHHNNRNGISVVSGKDVLIENNIIKNTSRKDMPGGIDVEPNNSAYTIENIRIKNNVLENIKGSGGAICLVVCNDGPVHRITISGNRIKNSTNGVFLYVETEGTSNDIVIKNNIIDRDTHPLYFVGEGESRNWTIKENTFGRAFNQTIPGDIKVDNLVVKNNKKKRKFVGMLKKIPCA